jgi:monoamine oxidase
MIFLSQFQSPVLQLAGEATSPRFYSTVHGAIESGQRAARNILRHYRMTSQI